MRAPIHNPEEYIPSMFVHYYVCVLLSLFNPINPGADSTGVKIEQPYNLVKNWQAEDETPDKGQHRAIRKQRTLDSRLVDTHPLSIHTPPIGTLWRDISFRSVVGGCRRVEHNHPRSLGSSFPGCAGHGFVIRPKEEFMGGAVEGWGETGNGRAHALAAKATSWAPEDSCPAWRWQQRPADQDLQIKGCCLVVGSDWDPERGGVDGRGVDGH